MKRTICALAAILSLTMPANAQTYEVVPVDLGDGYSILEGGFFTITDGELTDWSISVDGEHPFEFESPDTAGRFQAFLGVNVTETVLSIENGTRGGIRLREHYSEECLAELCTAIVDWSPELPGIEFSHRGRIDGGGNNPDIPDPGDYLFDVRAFVPISGTTVIATVPEPASASLMAFALLGVGLLRRRSFALRCFH